MDLKKLVRMTEERINNLTYSEMIEAMESLEDCHLHRRELLTAIHEGNNLERIGSAFMAALYVYHEDDVKLHEDFGDESY